MKHELYCYFILYLILLGGLVNLSYGLATFCTQGDLLLGVLVIPSSIWTQNYLLEMISLMKRDLDYYEHF